MPTKARCRELQSSAAKYKERCGACGGFNTYIEMKDGKRKVVIHEGWVANNYIQKMKYPCALRVLLEVLEDKGGKGQWFDGEWPPRKVRVTVEEI